MQNTAEVVAGSAWEDLPRLSRDEAWELLMSMRGMWSDQLQQYGGADEFARKLRNDEDPFA